jgi:hypothetical protein
MIIFKIKMKFKPEIRKTLITTKGRPGGWIAFRYAILGSPSKAEGSRYAWITDKMYLESS